MKMLEFGKRWMGSAAGGQTTGMFFELSGEGTEKFGEGGF